MIKRTVMHVDINADLKLSWTYQTKRVEEQQQTTTLTKKQANEHANINIT